MNRRKHLLLKYRKAKKKEKKTLFTIRKDTQDIIPFGTGNLDTSDLLSKGGDLTFSGAKMEPGLFIQRRSR